MDDDINKHIVMDDSSDGLETPISNLSLAAVRLKRRRPPKDEAKRKGQSSFVVFRSSTKSAAKPYSHV